MSSTNAPPWLIKTTKPNSLLADSLMQDIQFQDGKDEFCESKSGNCITTHDMEIQHVGSSNIEVEGE